MRTVGEHLDRVREQPHHVRKRVALGTAGALTALIAFVWLGTSLYTGTFALQGSNFAEVTGAETAAEAAGEPATSESPSARSEGVAAAAAAKSAQGAPAHVEVILNGTTTPAPSGPTIIPF